MIRYITLRFSLTEQYSVLSSKKLNIQLNAKQERRRVQENYTTICPTALRYSLRKEGKGWTKPGEK